MSDGKSFDLHPHETATVSIGQMVNGEPKSETFTVPVKLEDDQMTMALPERFTYAGPVVKIDTKPV